MANKPSMDSIRTPDLSKLEKNQGGLYDGYTPAQSKASGSSETDLKKKVEKNSAGSEKSNKGASSKSSVKAKRYIPVRKIVCVVVVIAVVFVLLTLFAPPIFISDEALSNCRSENIFEDIGAEQYKTQILESKTVYNIDALSSDLNESYRICTVAFKAINYTPLAVSVDDCVILSGGSFKEHIVFACLSDDTNEIGAFSSETINVEILINKDGLSDEEFDEAITSIVLMTSGTKKGSIPCVPAIMNVSNVISFDMNE